MNNSQKKKCRLFLLMKQCSISFIVREMLIKTTVRYNFSPTILAKPQNFDMIICLQDFWRQTLL